MNNNMDKLLDKLNSYNDVLILAHDNPDGDAYGSGIAIKKALQMCNIEADFYASENISGGLDGLISTKEFETDINLLKAHYDACICLDTSSMNYIYGKELINDCDELIVIDHHITNEQYGDINIVSEAAAACGEIVYVIVKGLIGEMPNNIATYLYIAISTDTGNFSYSNTTANSHVIASDLLMCGVDFAKVNEVIKTKSIKHLLLKKKALSNTLTFKSRKILAIFLVSEDINKDTDTEGIIDLIRYVKGCKVAVLVKRENEGSFKISLRSSTDKIDVSQVARKYGGGGHARAAGFSYSGTKDDVINIIKQIEV